MFFKLATFFLLFVRFFAFELRDSRICVQSAAAFIQSNPVSELLDTFSSIFHERIAIILPDKTISVDSHSFFDGGISDTDLTELVNKSGEFTIIHDSNGVESLVFTMTLSSSVDGDCTVVSPIEIETDSSSPDTTIQCIFKQVLSLSSGLDGDVLESIQSGCGSSSFGGEVIGFRESNGEIVYYSEDDSLHGSSLSSFQFGRFVESFDDLKTIAKDLFGGLKVLDVADPNSELFRAYQTHIYPVLESPFANTDFIFIALEEQIKALSVYDNFHQNYICDARSINLCSKLVSRRLLNAVETHFELAVTGGISIDDTLSMINLREDLEYTNIFQVNHDALTKFPILVMSSDGTIVSALESFSNSLHQSIDTLFSNWGLITTKGDFILQLKTSLDNEWPIKFQWMCPFDNVIKSYISYVSHIVIGDSAYYAVTPIELAKRDVHKWCSRLYIESCGIAHTETMISYANAEIEALGASLTTFDDMLDYLETLSLTSNQHSLMVLSMDRQTIAYDSMNSSLVGLDVSHWDVSESGWIEVDGPNLFELPEDQTKYAIYVSELTTVFGNVMFAVAMGASISPLEQPCNYYKITACGVNNLPKIVSFVYVSIVFLFFFCYIHIYLVFYHKNHRKASN
eukprot:TRINITY_DN2718_c0_g2_i5.p1 TRINITY_DN2718_c0_g2~~TRINITY_DN2718_c0_g2_i5.p1  ORF type:complete len:628 (-),score=112.07 TRINITY_DN2718_c0_g2_i5:81-1964(-)